MKMSTPIYPPPIPRNSYMVGEDMRRVVRDSDGEKRVCLEEGKRAKEGRREGDFTKSR
jgi:hypothetical protein